MPLPPARWCTLFPYTTLFRSWRIVVPTEEDSMAADGRVEAPAPTGTGNRNGWLWLNLFRSFQVALEAAEQVEDRKSTRLNSSHVSISYAVFCLKKKKKNRHSP